MGHVISLFSKDSSCSNASCLKSFLDIVSRVTGVVGDAIVLGVLAAFVRGVADPLLGVMFTVQII